MSRRKAVPRNRSIANIDYGVRTRSVVTCRAVISRREQTNWRGRSKYTRDGIRYVATEDVVFSLCIGLRAFFFYFLLKTFPGRYFIRKTRFDF